MLHNTNSELTDEQQMILDSAHRFIEQSCQYERRREAVQAGVTLDRTMWKDIADLGWFGLGLKEDVGGFGGSLTDVALISEAVGKGQMLEPYLLCGFFPGRLLSRIGTTEANQLLAGIITGETIVAVAHSEPDARGDVANLAVVARETEAGWRIDGRKSLVVGGDIADLIVVSARLSGGGAGLFALPRATPGLTVEGTRLIDWTSGTDLVFDGAAAQLLTTERNQPSALDAAKVETIVMLCAELVGAMEGAIDTTAAYIRERRQFGASLSTFQALQHRMSDMAIELVIARSAVLRALTFVDAEDLSERAAQVSACKALVTRIAKWTTAQGIQLHGGYGLTEEYRVGQYYKRALVIDALFGRQETHLRIFKNYLITKARQTGGTSDERNAIGETIGRT
ncbi:pimeloyl-CoA dehydrogenase small subunit protein (plasmid) [Rhizobium gallicum]|uniref:Pimeloyl-CoA dehydrogenase small subunit protein n=1 Tax=Rhizobium gallicum TaxID=56730 RepID=A0A1L5NS59_9HYPH|nr:acyl-CoA dehydrogenase family protein [Rhizobium gallicum]APO70708.1 pimeloyl-CoA dehydrogenase small subunit protein [Rhizobium gallicum]